MGAGRNLRRLPLPDADTGADGSRTRMAAGPHRSPQDRDGRHPLLRGRSFRHQPIRRSPYGLLQPVRDRGAGRWRNLPDPVYAGGQRPVPQDARAGARHHAGRHGSGRDRSAAAALGHHHRAWLADRLSAAGLPRPGALDLRRDGFSRHGGGSAAQAGAAPRRSHPSADFADLLDDSPGLRGDRHRGFGTGGPHGSAVAGCGTAAAAGGRRRLLHRLRRSAWPPRHRLADRPLLRALCRGMRLHPYRGRLPAACLWRARMPPPSRRF